MVVMGDTDILLQAIKQAMFKVGREVGTHLVSLLLAGSPSDDDSTLCDIDSLSMKNL